MIDDPDRPFILSALVFFGPLAVVSGAWLLVVLL